MANNNSSKRTGFAAPFVVFLLLMAFWIPFSGTFDAFHLSLGVISCAFVAIISHKFLFEDFSRPGKLKKTIRFIAYLPWLIYQIILSNLHVVHMILFPSKIRPQIVMIKPALKSELSMVTLANSITLTPGTVTMEIIDGQYYVHAISQKAADDLVSGDMEKRVAHVFFED